MSADGCHPAVRQCSLRTPIAARKGSRADPPGNILCIVEQEDLEELQISNVELAIPLPSGVIGLLARASQLVRIQLRLALTWQPLVFFSVTEATSTLRQTSA